MQYDFDLFVVVGGDISVVTDPTGIRLPRVFLGRAYRYGAGTDEH